MGFLGELGRSRTDISGKLADPPKPGRSGQRLLLPYQRRHLVSGATLTFFRGQEDCLDVEAVLGGFVLANAPSFVGNRVSLYGHILPSSSGGDVNLERFS